MALPLHVLREPKQVIWTSSQLNSFKPYDIFTAKRTKEETQKSIYAPGCSKGKHFFHVYFFNMLTVAHHLLLFQNKTTQKKNENQNGDSGSDLAEVL